MLSAKEGMIGYILMKITKMLKARFAELSPSSDATSVMTDYRHIAILINSWNE